MGSVPHGGTVGRYWLGCSGWAYDDWVGPFYPPGTPPGEFLERYAKVFRTVEVDSSFYRPPGPFLVRRWAERTPPEFRFALKVPRDVTHEEGETSRAVLNGFLESLAPLRASGKLGPLVLQFPASFRATQAARLATLLDAVPPTFSLAVELRHGSWWTPGTRTLLEGRGAVLVWSVMPATRPPSWVTGDFLYARFIGDRALTRFDRIQRDRRADLVAMRQRFDDDGRSATTVFAFSNNHFMGFGPGTVEVLADVLGEPRPDLSAASLGRGQTRIDDPTFRAR
jgi:uncharacterized protein YecE (DUF72 family)